MKAEIQSKQIRQLWFAIRKSALSGDIDWRTTKKYQLGVSCKSLHNLAQSVIKDGEFILQDGKLVDLSGKYNISDPYVPYFDDRQLMVGISPRSTRARQDLIAVGLGWAPWDYYEE